MIITLVKFIILLTMIPLILLIGIIPSISSSDIPALPQICVGKVWIESVSNRIACVTPTTAEKLVERGWGTLLDIDQVIEDASDEKSIIPVISGGTHPPDVSAIRREC